MTSAICTRLKTQHAARRVRISASNDNGPRLRATRKDEAWSGTARRVLQQLFAIDREAIHESDTLADFEGCNLPDVNGPLTPMAWRIHVKDRVFSCFGVDCEIDEPLSCLVARIELAEHGVGCSLGHRRRTAR